MDISTLSLKFAGALRLAEELVLYGIPGTVFLLLWGTNPNALVHSLVHTPSLGYVTRIVLLVLLGALIGLVLEFFGAMFVRFVAWLISLLGKRITALKHFSEVPDLTLDLALQAFNTFEQQEGVKHVDINVEYAREASGEVLGLLLMYYTSASNYLRRLHRLRLQTMILTSGMFGAALAYGLLNVLNHDIRVFFLALISLPVALIERNRTLKTAHRIIAVGFLMETKGTLERESE